MKIPIKQNFLPYMIDIFGHILGPDMETHKRELYDNPE